MNARLLLTNRKTRAAIVTLLEQHGKERTEESKKERQMQLAVDLCREMPTEKLPRESKTGLENGI